MFHTEEMSSDFLKSSSAVILLPSHDEQQPLKSSVAQHQINHPGLSPLKSVGGKSRHERRLGGRGGG